jgi:phosphohistidine swiveling domain-containing protein
VGAGEQPGTTDATADGQEIPPDFRVEWEPADADLMWEWDDMHWPHPLAPLAADYGLVICAGINSSYSRFGVPWQLRARIVAGYGYMAMDYGVPEAEVKETVDRWHGRQREFIPDNARYWRDEAMPALREAHAFVEEIDVDALDREALAEAWQAAWERVAGTWLIHFVAIRGAYQVAEDLSDLYERVIPGAAPGEALSLIQGANDVLQEVDAGIETLTDRIATDERLADRLARPPLPSLDEIDQLAPSIGADLRSFLRTHGHLGQTFDDLSQPSWSEEPSMLIGELAKRLVSPPERHADRRSRLRLKATRLLESARGQLADKPDELAELDRLYGAAMEIGALTEVHNYWIDRMSQARLRALAFRIGARLVGEGVLGDPSDALYLYHREIGDLVRDPADVREMIAERRAEHARQRTLKPPIKLGRPEPDFGFTSRFDVPREEAGSADELKGTGASVGVVRGTARVALGPEDFPRIRRGDIIVCPSSNPSWVPVFAIAGGLVTNTGGVLAHAAVVAREFGLPAVVGVAGATSRIADGRLVEIDGATGIVRLL